jgi:hypothetical protein
MFEHEMEDEYQRDIYSEIQGECIEGMPVSVLGICRMWAV